MKFKMNVSAVMLYFSQDNIGNNMLHNVEQFVIFLGKKSIFI